MTQQDRDYIVLVDESGDIGLNNVQADPSRGPTQYFTMAAVILAEVNRSKIEATLNNLPYAVGTLHANKLSHFEKVDFCRTVSRLPLGLVGVISNKLSLGDYLGQASRTNTHFYNKVAHYLLERVGEAIQRTRINKDSVRIVIEAREQPYGSLLAYLGKIQKTPFHEKSAFLGSRLIDLQSQNMTVAASATADRKVLAHLS